MSEVPGTQTLELANATDAASSSAAFRHGIPRATDRIHLPKRARATMRALIETIQPIGGIFTLRLEDHMLQFTEEMLVFLPKDLRLLFPVGLLLLEFGTLPFMGWLTPFSKLSIEDRERYIDNWAESRIGLRRDLIKGLRALALLGYFEHPEIKKQLDFMSDEYVEEIGEKRLELYGREIAEVQKRFA